MQQLENTFKTSEEEEKMDALGEKSFPSCSTFGSKGVRSSKTDTHFPSPWISGGQMKYRVEMALCTSFTTFLPS